MRAALLTSCAAALLCACGGATLDANLLVRGLKVNSQTAVADVLLSNRKDDPQNSLTVAVYSAGALQLHAQYTYDKELLAKDGTLKLLHLNGATADGAQASVNTNGCPADPSCLYLANGGAFSIAGMAEKVCACHPAAGAPFGKFFGVAGTAELYVAKVASTIAAGCPKTSGPAFGYLGTLTRAKLGNTGAVCGEARGQVSGASGRRSLMLTFLPDSLTMTPTSGSLSPGPAETRATLSLPASDTPPLDTDLTQASAMLAVWLNGETTTDAANVLRLTQWDAQAKLASGKLVVRGAADDATFVFDKVPLSLP